VNVTNPIAGPQNGRLAGLSQRILTSDYLRRSPASAGGRIGHKEWTHFCVFGEQVDLMVNFSLMDGVQTGATPAAEVPRLALLVRDTGGWEGDVDRFTADEVDIAGGRIDLHLGPNRLRFVEGIYHLDARLADRPVQVRLRLRPRVTPALTNSVALGLGGSVKWLVIPHLLADGEILVAGRRHVLSGAPAYHDHNWGSFAWGADFSWDWAIVVPPDPSTPWSLVLTRLSDRGRHRVHSEGLLLWKRDTHQRTFRGTEVEFHSSGFLRRRQPLRIPRVMRLVSPGNASDVPSHMVASGRSGSDHLDLELEMLDFGQIAIPSDADPSSVTVLSEVLATGRVEGTVRGEAVRLEGPALVELIRVVR
jgi:hypothetical protein